MFKSKASNFIRGVFVTVLLLAAMCCAPSEGKPPANGGSCDEGSCPLPPSNSDLIAASRSATVVLFNHEGTKLMCAGTKISPTEILTAYHCAVATVLPREILNVVEQLSPSLTDVEIESLSQLPISFQTYAEVEKEGLLGVTHVAFTSKFDRMSDLAVLRTQSSSQPYVKVSQSDLASGDGVYAIGHPARNVFAYTRGYVSTPCRVEDEVCMTELDLTIAGGSSGGGLYNLRGELVGVASSSYDFALCYFATPASIRSLLSKGA